MKSEPLLKELPVEGEGKGCFACLAPEMGKAEVAGESTQLKKLANPCATWEVPALLVDVLLLLTPLINVTYVYLITEFDTGNDLHHFLFSFAAVCMLIRAMGFGISEWAASSGWLTHSMLGAALWLSTAIVMFFNLWPRNLRAFEASLLLSAVSSVASDRRTDSTARVRRVVALALPCVYGIGVAVADGTTVASEIKQFFLFCVGAVAILVMLLGTSRQSCVAMRFESSKWDLPVRAICDGGRTTIRVNNDFCGIFAHIGYAMWWMPPLSALASASHEIVVPTWFKYLFEVRACVPVHALLPVLTFHGRRACGTPQALFSGSP